MDATSCTSFTFDFRQVNHWYPHCIPWNSTKARQVETVVMYYIFDYNISLSIAVPDIVLYCELVYNWFHFISFVGTLNLQDTATHSQLPCYYSWSSHYLLIVDILYISMPFNLLSW